MQKERVHAAIAAKQKEYDGWGPLHRQIRAYRLQVPPALPPGAEEAFDAAAAVIVMGVISAASGHGETASGHGYNHFPSKAAEDEDAESGYTPYYESRNAEGTIRYRSKEDKESDERMLKSVAEERAASGSVFLLAVSSPCNSSSRCNRTGAVTTAFLLAKYADDLELTTDSEGERVPRHQRRGPGNARATASGHGKK